MSTPNTLTLLVTLAEVERQTSRPDSSWQMMLGKIRFTIKKGMDRAYLISSDDPSARFRILKTDQSVLRNSRQGEASVVRDDLIHQNGGGIIIELL